MKIIKPGKANKEPDYFYKCDNCACEFTFKMGETAVEDEELSLLGMFRIKCPCCYKDNWVSKLTLFDENPKRAKVNIPKLDNPIWSCVYYFKDDNLDEDNTHKKHDMSIILDNRSKVKPEFINKISMGSTSYSGFIAADDPFDAGVIFKKLIEEYE